MDCEALPIAALVFTVLGIVLAIVAAVSPGWTIFGNIHVGTMYQCLAEGSCSAITVSIPAVATAVLTIGALFPLGIGLGCMIAGIKLSAKSNFTVGSISIFIAVFVEAVALGTYGVINLVNATPYGYSYYLGWVSVCLAFIGGSFGLIYSLKGTT